jgi:hypothetical protein
MIRSLKCFAAWRLAGMALLLSTLPVPARAQHSHGYLFIAPGGVSGGGNTEATFQIGAGGEGVFGKGIGAGVEISALGPASSWAEDVLGVASFNGYYHFIHSGSRLDPYATGGYSLLFRSGHANLGNFGAGVNYWFIPRIGMKAEFRDHVWSPSDGTLHYWGVRFGLTFR